MNRAAIYCRLSDEDRDKRHSADESESIQNQKSMLLKYVMDRGWELYKIYCDEDYSGADRTRPEWNAMLADAKAGKFDILICKTQSRFSRDMEIVERYIHGEFLEWGIRFIGVVDNADTEIEGNKKARQINGLINEWYLEDLSHNIKRTLNHKKDNGQWTGSFAPYGYCEDLEDRNHLVVDPVAAKIVRKIFEMYASGSGYITIAKTLNELDIPNPSRYKELNGSKFKTNHSEPTKSAWTDSTIYQILRREVYTGTLVQSFSKNISYKSNKRRKNPYEKQSRTPNAHEPIIEPGLWDSVQEKLAKKGRSEKFSGEEHIFGRKVFCGECGNTMWKMSYKLADGRYQYLKCKTVKTTDGICENKSGLRLDALTETVRSEINKLLYEFYNPDLISLPEVVNENETLLVERKEFQVSIDKKTAYLDKIYEDKLSGTITGEQYIKFKQKFNCEIEALTGKIKLIDEKLSTAEDKTAKEAAKTALLKKYRYIEVLDRTTADEFISQIRVGTAQSDGNREIEIVWRL